MQSYHYYQVVFPKHQSPVKNVFTYHSQTPLKLGDGIVAELRKQQLRGVVLKKTFKPKFVTKPILEKFANNLLSPIQLKLAEYINGYYFSGEAAAVNLFCPKKFDKINDEILQSVTSSKVKISVTLPDFELNTTQKQVLKAMQENPQKIHLIHGITGSGKTILYLKKVEEIIKQGHQVLILIPEISLTPQTIKVFSNYFSAELLSVYHSRLNPTEQLKEYLNIRNNISKIIIGSRSSLFLPFQNLKLIILDEEHDHAYKQDNNPKYHARTIAQWYHQNQQIELIFGSATPSLETYKASTQNNKVVKHEILHRSQYQTMPKVQLIDMKTEHKKGNFSPLSEILVTKITDKLAKKEPVLILHNKRGFANYLQCQNCGEVVNCPNCSISLTLHKNQGNNRLKCHYCNFHTHEPSSCSHCQDLKLQPVGAGIQKIYNYLEQTFPQAVIKRVDADTTTGKNAHQELFEALAEDRYDIIVGTQMIATGLDLKNINLVAVTNADISLHMPDFRATERAFQLLTQFTGRSGRGNTTGEVLIQTFSPQNPVLQSVKNHDFESFYTQELSNRSKFKYPPFSKLTQLTCSAKQAAKVTKEIATVEQTLRDLKIPFKSSPALIEKQNGKYYHHIILNSLKPENILQQLPLNPYWTLNRDPLQII